MTLVTERPTSSPCARAAAFIGVLLLGGAGLASADWLVTTDGELIETRGAWRVEGSRVVFAAANGTLTAVRASSIDFPATEAYAAELAAPVVAPPAPAEPVLVLTERDVPRVRTAEPVEPVEPGAAETEAGPDAEGTDATATAAAEDGESAEPTSEATPSAPEATATPAPAAEGESADKAAAPPAKPATQSTQALPSEVTVTSWQEQSLDTGVRFIGTLANDSKAFATQLRVEVALYDEAGRLIETKRASLARNSISPGRSTTFDVSFPGVFAYGEVRFTPGGRSLQGRDDSSAEASAPQTEPPLR